MSNFITIHGKDDGDIHVNLEKVESFRKIADAAIMFKFSNKSLEIEFDTVKDRDETYKGLVWVLCKSI